MSVVGAVQERSDTPAYVRFERVAVENKAKSLEAGRFVADDVDFALITPPYSKDCIKIKVKQWLLNLDADVNNQRIPPEWRDKYLKAYDAWKNGQELPLDGTPIRGWGVISPAQQETLIRLNILTVENLAQANDEGLRRIGMGALELKTKAVAWLHDLNSRGHITQEMAALKVENENLKQQVETLMTQVAGLVKGVPRGTPEQNDLSTEISADDILPETKTLKLKR